MDAFKTDIRWTCEALIDQGRMIGSDPVGHACSRWADYEIPHEADKSFLLCSECAEELAKIPPTGKVTLRTPRSMPERFATVNQVIRRLK